MMYILILIILLFAIFSMGFYFKSVYGRQDHIHAAIRELCALVLDRNAQMLKLDRADKGEIVTALNYIVHELDNEERVLRINKLVEYFTDDHIVRIERVDKLNEGEVFYL